MSDPYSLSAPASVAHLESPARARFLQRTYAHLLAAILAFTAFEILLFQTGAAETIARAFTSISWLWVLGGFMLVSWLASRVAFAAKSTAAQYAALAGFVVAQGLIFVPLLYVAMTVAPDGSMIRSAALVTALAFTGLTATVFFTGKDFSFLRGLLTWGFVIALVAIVAGVIFGFQLGTLFSVAMVGLAGAAILYDTSKVMRSYPEDRYVGAALQLFASVAMMLWYVLRIFLSRD